MNLMIDDYLMDTLEPVDDLAKAFEGHREDVPDNEVVPTKGVSILSQKIQINSGIQFIDSKSRTEGESLIKLTAQLKLKRKILVREGKRISLL